jgi:type 1 glutamine amidotransferase
MTRRSLTTLITAGAAAALLVVSVGSAPRAQAPAPLARSTSADLGGLLSTTLVFTAADANKDGAVTRDELRTAVEAWVTAADAANAGGATRDQLIPALNTALPMSGLAAAFNMGGRGGQPQTPDPVTVERMMAALPNAAPAKPQRPRKVLVLAKAGGFVHSSIPLAAKTIEALGTKTGAWSTTITYDSADITTENLKQYDAIFLASTTGAFLDAPGDTAATEARRQAFLSFVRGGKGIAGIHAASDSYHQNSPQPGGAGRGTAGANPLASFAAGPALAPVLLAQGDRNRDQKLDRAEAAALANAWFDAIDTNKTGRLISSDFASLALLIPKAAGATGAQGPDNQVGTWPDFNRLIGGYFKYHWLDPQQITMKIDDRSSPLTKMFTANNLVYHDEIYTMGRQSFSRANVRVLTSIDYAKMSAEDKAQEENPRTDGDYGLSWIRREGQGRVFYEALGHSERIYAMRPILEHLLAGMQYVIGDLKVDDTPVK